MDVATPRARWRAPTIGVAAPPRSHTWARLRRDRAAMAGMVIVSVLVTLAVAAPLLNRLGVLADPLRLDLRHADAGVSLRHPLGSDDLGRDLLSRAVYGARISLSMGLLVQGLVLVVGSTVGVAAALAGRWVDDVLMRLTDVMYAFPALLFVLVVASTLRSGYWSVFVAIGLVGWAPMARIVRGQVMAVRSAEYIEAATLAGSRGWRLVRHHVVPNCVGPVIVTVVFGIPAVIFLEAFLSFVSVGVHPPAPSWGVMVAEGTRTMFSSPLQAFVPAAAIGMATLAFNLLGDGLRDALSMPAGDRTTEW